MISLELNLCDIELLLQVRDECEPVSRPAARLGVADRTSQILYALFEREVKAAET
jgi:hypothetical protein